MFKKIILSVLMLTAFAGMSQAATYIKVEAMEEFTTANPPANMCLMVASNYDLGNYYLKSGDVLTCEVVKVVKPKRGKRDAKFYVKPTEITSDGSTSEITKNYKGSYCKYALSKEALKAAPKVKMVEKAAVSVGNHFVKGCLAPAVSIAEGMIKNEEGNRLKSGIAQLYDDSPVSYVSKGKDIEFKQGDTFYLSFKVKKPRRNKEAEQPETEQPEVQQD